MKRLPYLAALLLLQACATTSEMPLAPNMVRIDTQASGLAFTGSAPAMTMKKAAETTLARGYSHFRLEQVSTSSGRHLAGVIGNSSGTMNATAFGNTAYGTYSGTSYATPVYAPTANIGVTVIMFHAGDAGARGAWDAADVLKKGGRV